MRSAVVLKGELMIDDATVEKLLEELRPTLPASIVGFDVETGLDHVGDEAVWVWVILPDADTAAWEYANREMIRWKIQDAALEAKLPWVYIRFREESERRRA